jgi:hypothetical protein
MTTRQRTSVPLLLPFAVLLLAGCSAAGGASPSPSPSPSPSAVAVTSPDEAEARVEALHPEFAGMAPLDPDVIGACCWSEAKAVEGGYQVTFTIGWGDCPAGCINRHVWTFAVSPGGEVALIGEEGPPVPPDVMSNAGG